MPKFKIPVQLRKAPLSGSIEKRHGTIKNELNAQTVIQKPTNSTNKDNPCPKVLNIVKEPASIEDTIEVLEEESWLLNEGDIIETVEEISQVPVQSTNEIMNKLESLENTVNKLFSVVGIMRQEMNELKKDTTEIKSVVAEMGVSVSNFAYRADKVDNNVSNVASTIIEDDYDFKFPIQNEKELDSLIESLNEKGRALALLRAFTISEDDRREKKFGRFFSGDVLDLYGKHFGGRNYTECPVFTVLQRSWVKGRFDCLSYDMFIRKMFRRHRERKARKQKQLHQNLRLSGFVDIETLDMHSAKE